MKKLSLISFSLLILFLINPSYSTELKEIYSEGKKLKVIDGDTINIDTFKIRLHGIDAPEMGQICLDKEKKPYDCGILSKEYLKKIIGKRKVVCVYDSLDRYNRILGTCYIFGQYSDGENTITNMNGIMVASGHAVAYTKYSNRYLKNEKIPKRARIGIWQGDFERPEEWRKKNR